MTQDIELILSEIPAEMVKAKEAGIPQFSRQFKFAWSKISLAKNVGYTHKQIYEAIKNGIVFKKEFTYKYYENLYYRTQAIVLKAESKTSFLANQTIEKPSEIKNPVLPKSAKPVTPVSVQEPVINEPELDSAASVNRIQKDLQKYDQKAQVDWAKVRKQNDALQKAQASNKS